MQQGKHQGKIIISLDDIQTEGELPFVPTYMYTGTYLITGGMGAIGLQVAQWLITEGITNLVLLERSNLKPEFKAKLQKL